jgi:hypothetical protein
MRARLYSFRSPLVVLVAMVVLIAGCSGAAKGRIAAPDGRTILTERPAVPDGVLPEEPEVEVLGTTVEGPEPAPAPSAVAPEPLEVAPKVEPAEPVMWAIVGVPVGLNLRSGPATTFDVLVGVEKDKLLTGTGMTKGSWTQVISDGTTGWVVSAYLEAVPASEDESN